MILYTIYGTFYRGTLSQFVLQLEAFGALEFYFQRCMAGEAHGVRGYSGLDTDTRQAWSDFLELWNSLYFHGICLLVIGNFLDFFLALSGGVCFECTTTLGMDHGRMGSVIG